ncbi:MAG: AEC family transporter, partial [Candidatus Marinimicrobia bacterium]|nr:AEC family transporter [Candidatus Neomarinimicrobiota bacterium]
FRSNFAILGLAILFNLFGKNVMPTASVVLGFLMPLFNILSVIALLKFKVGDAGKNDVKFWREIFRNPLILAAIVSLPFSWFSWPIPIFMEKSIDYLASLSMPLALIGIGGSMSFRGLQRNFLIIFISSILKIIILPIVVTSLAVFLGFRGHELGIVFVFFGTPTAIVSFIMAKAMDSDSLLTANIILLSTLGSIFTMGAGIYILKYLQLI